MGFLAAVGLIVGTATTVYGITNQRKQMKKARRAQERARQQQIKADKLKQRKEMLAQIRRARIARGQVLQGGANAGAYGSSSVVGGAGSASSQAIGNIDYVNTLGFYNEATSGYLQQAANAQSRAQEFGALTNLGFSMFQYGLGGIGSSPTSAKPNVPPKG